MKKAYTLLFASFMLVFTAYSQPRIIYSQVQTANTWVDVIFNTGVYADAGGTMAVSTTCFDFTFTKGTGNATNCTVSAVKQNDAQTEGAASELTGGEQILRFFLAVTGLPNGDETIEIEVTGSNTIYDEDGTAANPTETTGTLNLHLVAPEPAGSITGDATVCQGEQNVTYSVDPIDNADEYYWITPDGQLFTTVSPSLDIDYEADAVSGNVEVYGANAAGFGASATFAVTVNETSLPADAIVASESEICQGESITLYVSGGDLAAGASWNWYTGSCGGTSVGTGSSLAVSPTSNTTFYLRAQGGSCPATSCVSKAIVVNSLPVVTLTIANDTLSDKDAPEPLSGSPAGGDFFGPGVSSSEALFYPAQAGTSTVAREIVYVYADANQCQKSDTIEVWVLPSAPHITYSALQAGNTYVDVVFDAGVYGNDSHSLPVNTGCFALTFIKGTGNATACVVSSVKKNDAQTEGAASNLTGGETTLRFFLAVTGLPNGDETIEIEVSGTGKVFSYEGIEAYPTETTGTLNLHLVAPEPAGSITGDATVCQGEQNVAYSVDPIDNADEYYWITPDGQLFTTVSPSLDIDYEADAVSGNVEVYGANAAGFGASATFAVTVNETSLPADAIVASESEICQGESITLYVSGGDLAAGASWNWYTGSCGGASVGTGSSLAVSPTSNTTFYLRAQGGSCPATSCVSKAIVVNSLPVVTLTIANDTLSDKDAPEPLIVSPSGGQLSGPGVVPSESTFHPQLVGAAAEPYEIVYTYTESATQCTNSDTAEVAVISIDETFVGLDAVYCKNDGTVLIEVSSGASLLITSGTFLIDGFVSPSRLQQTGMLTAQFYPVNVSPGMHQIIYSGWYAYVIPFTISKNIMVYEVKEPKINNLAEEYCADAPSVHLLASDPYPPGSVGHWGGPPDGLVPHPTFTNEATFSPSTITNPGNYQVSFYYTYDAGTKVCTSLVAREYVDIHPLPEITYELASNFNYESQPVLLSALPSGGDFSGQGVYANIFSPGNVTPASGIPITYTYTDINTCTNAMQLTTSVRRATETISGLNEVYCYGTAPFVISCYANGYPALKGTFSSAGTGIVSNTNTAIYDPQAAGAGQDEVVFTYVIDTTTYRVRQNVYIDSVGTVDFLGLDSYYCKDHPAVTLYATSTTHPGGTGSFSAPTMPLDAFFNYGYTAVMKPSVLNAGQTYTIRYRYTSNLGTTQCSSETEKQVLIRALPSVDFDLREHYSLEGGRDTLITSPPIGTPAQGSLAGSGIFSGDSVFYPDMAGLGSHLITYTYSDDYGCRNSLSKTTTVVTANAEILGLAADNQYCYEGATDTLVGKQNNGIGQPGMFSGAGIVQKAGTDTAFFYPSMAGSGTHFITYGYWGENSVWFIIVDQLKVDSIGEVQLLGFTESDFCKNAKPVQLIGIPSGGTFWGTGVSGSTFVPRNATPGPADIIYRYINTRTGCAKYDTFALTVFDLPNIGFSVNDRCIYSGSSDSTKFINSTASADPVIAWQWDFDDLLSGPQNISTIFEPRHMFMRSGPHLIQLTATTDQACSDTLAQLIDFGDKPFADFDWNTDCYKSGNATGFTNQTIAGDAIDSYLWTIRKPTGEAVYSSDKEDFEFEFPETGEYNVSLQANTIVGCKDTTDKQLYLRPTIVLKDQNYFEDFEDNAQGWVAECPAAGEPNNWLLDTPQGEDIDAAASGTNAWHTHLDFDYQQHEMSWVSSPCFDFTDVGRPMIKFNLFSDPSPDRSGAVLQYTLNNGDSWQNVGSLDDGINWYNSFSIKSNPGGQPLGWSGSNFPKKWTSVRHDLDVLRNKTNVKFRMAFATDGAALEPFDGVAFDDIWVGQRSMNVMLEHFTNSSQVASKDANSEINSLINILPADVLNVQYHISYPAADPFNAENPSDPGARALFYGINSGPFAVMNGTERFDFDLRTPGDLDLVKQSLRDPAFAIDIEASYNGFQLGVDVELTALTALPSKRIVVQVAAIEMEVNREATPTGETRFINVLRRMLPDAGGTYYNRTWNIGDKASFSYSKPVLLADPTKLNVIVFVQNDETKEIYQAVSLFTPDVFLGIPDQNLVTKNRLILYPNPARNNLTIRSESLVSPTTRIHILDRLGRLCMVEAAKGNSEQTIDIEKLSKGFYLVRLIQPDGGAETAHFVKSD